MNKISEAQFFDYMNCPALYEMKHERGLPMAEDVSVSQLLNKISKYFYLNMINGKICTMAELKKKWDSLCIGKDFTPKQVMDGMNLIMKFGNWASREQLIVLDIDMHYIIKAGETELVGNIGTIVSAGNGKTELLITDFSSKLPEQALIDMKSKYTIDAYAFEQVYGKPLDGIRIHSVKHDKDFYTHRSKDDYSRVITSVKSIGQLIKSSVYYTRESFMCGTCAAKPYCKYWTKEV